MPKTLGIGAYLSIAFALAAVAPANAAPASTAQDLSDQCKGRGAELFRQAWPEGAAGSAAVRAAFKSHYNAKMGRCFYLETVSQLERSPALNRILPRETQRLVDANGKTEYGIYDSWRDMPPMTCSLQGASCTTRREWLNLIKPYMQD